MSTKSSIEWTEYTWNPLTGCTKVSPGCKNCYAERMANRLKAMGVKKYAQGFQLVLHENVLSEPATWKRPRLVFVNSMSDLFHEAVPVSFIQRVLDVMRQADQSIFQVLTKRSTRLAELDARLVWPANVWLGVSVESADYLYRVDDLKSTRARIRFLSLEPLLGPLQNLNVSGIDWVIVGGESGPFARPMQAVWATEIRDKCVAHSVPFFFKQWGGVNKKLTGRKLDGRTWDGLPKNIQGKVLL
jgi:protein gp37